MMESIEERWANDGEHTKHISCKLSFEQALSASGWSSL